MAKGTIEAYAFVSGPPDPQGFARELLGVDGVRFATQTVGSFDAFLAVSTSDLGDLQDRVVPAALAPGPSEVRWSIVAIESRAKLPKRRLTAVCALIRVLAAEPAAVVEGLDRRFGDLNERDGFGFGAAVVTGKGIDVLLDLGAPSFEETMELVFAAREIGGIDRTDTTLAAPPEHAWAPGA